MKYAFIAVGVFCSLIIFGCDKTSSRIITATQPCKGMTEVISDPSGARIEVNGDYIGDAPLFVKLPRPSALKRHRDTSEGTVTVIAYPVGERQYRQVKYLDVRRRVPSRIFFDMNLEPMQPTQRIEIDDKH